MEISQDLVDLLRVFRLAEILSQLVGPLSFLRSRSTQAFPIETTGPDCFVAKTAVVFRFNLAELVEAQVISWIYFGIEWIQK
jgi:hypothetical protein